MNLFLEIKLKYGRETMESVRTVEALAKIWNYTLSYH